MQNPVRQYVVADEKFLCDENGSLVSLNDIDFISLSVKLVVKYPLKSAGENHLYVACVQPKNLAGYQWLNLRDLLELLSEDAFQTAGRALQILRWHFDHQFCGRCGQSTVEYSQELIKKCMHCALDFYPRLSPCIITLLTRGDECLLAWHTRSKEEKYSCLAGFIEIGESPEQTLEREVMEEVGLRVRNIRYVASQPWPFPGQLMLGYFADYSSGDIQVDQEEIVSAHWFKYNQLPKTPRAGTISWHLINTFVQERLRINNIKD